MSEPTEIELAIAERAAWAMIDDHDLLAMIASYAYCYSVFVRVGGVYSAGRTIKARAFDATTRPGRSVKWAYATGGTAA